MRFPVGASAWARVPPPAPLLDADQIVGEHRAANRAYAAARGSYVAATRQLKDAVVRYAEETGIAGLLVHPEPIDGGVHGVGPPAAGRYMVRDRLKRFSSSISVSSKAKLSSLLLVDALIGLVGRGFGRLGGGASGMSGALVVWAYLMKPSSRSTTLLG